MSADEVMRSCRRINFRTSLQIWPRSAPLRRPDLCGPAGGASPSGKWLEQLREIAPGMKRAAVLRDPASPAVFRLGRATLSGMVSCSEFRPATLNEGAESGDR